MNALDIEGGEKLAWDLLDPRGRKAALGEIQLATDVHLRVLEGVSVRISKRDAKRLCGELRDRGRVLVGWRMLVPSRFEHGPRHGLRHLLVCAGRER